MGLPRDSVARITLKHLAAKIRPNVNYKRIRLWLPLDIIKPIYADMIKPTTRSYNTHITMKDINEQIKDDNDRWVEVPNDPCVQVPEDYMETEVRYLYERGFNTLVILKKNYENIRPRDHDYDYCNWRHNIKIGDIVEDRKYQNEYYNGVVLFVYPKDDAKKAGKCLISNSGYLRTMDIDLEHIFKR